MDTWSKEMVFAATGGLVLTALSVLIIDEESVFMYTWGFPVPYFEKLYPDAIGSHGGVFIWWTQALLDFAFWFMLCTVAVGAIGLAWHQVEPVTRSETAGKSPVNGAEPLTHCNLDKYNRT
jgi:hypothetical protein